MSLSSPRVRSISLWHYAIDGYAAIVVVIALYLLMRRLLPDRIPVRAS